MLTFRDQKILISGASSGIGNSVANLLNSLGVNTVLIGRDKLKLEKTLSQLQQPENASIIICDFLDEINLKGEFLKSVADSGTFTGFVHSAGADITKPYKLLKNNDFDTLNKLNVTAPFQVVKELLKKSTFSSTGGSIVWLGSVMGSLGQKGKIAYTSSKAAVEGLVKSLALELAGKNIRVNCVAPGIVETPLTRELFSKLSGDSINSIEAMHPLGFGKPEDVANLICFLLSDQSKWITGTTYCIDGGYHIQ
jgi:NAD(P)-dependent dehydrogenase (short-subunit alcohol dehydrogenase family)|tara:strand:+ start:847 stop:1602 length:756 start_codon:yes stop_codon:yes gene_type:complete